MPNALEWQSYLDNQARQALAPARERIAENLANFRQTEADKRAQQGNEALANLQARAAAERAKIEADARLEAQKYTQFAESERLNQTLAAQELARKLVRAGELEDRAASNRADLEQAAMNLGIAPSANASLENLQAMIAAESRAQYERGLNQARFTAGNRDDLLLAARQGRMTEEIISAVRSIDPAFADVLGSTHNSAVSEAATRFNTARGDPAFTDLMRRAAIASDPAVLYRSDLTNALSKDGVIVADRLVDALKRYNLSPADYGLGGDYEEKIDEAYRVALLDGYNPSDDQATVEQGSGTRGYSEAKARLDAYGVRVNASRAIDELAAAIATRQSGSPYLSGEEITVRNTWFPWDKITIPSHAPASLSDEDAARLEQFRLLEEIADRPRIGSTQPQRNPAPPVAGAAPDQRRPPAGRAQ